MLKAIIFDMDGVLVKPRIWHTFNILLAKYGVHISDEDIKNKYAGRSLRDQLSMIEKEHGLAPIDLDEFSKQSTKMQLDGLKGEAKPDPYVLRLITAAKKQGIKIAVATSSGKSRAEQLLKIVDVYDKLDLLITAQDVEKHKPDPDIFLEVSKSFSIRPNECIVFEDALNGIQAALSAGMKVIGITTTHYSREDLESADMVIDNFSEIDFDILTGLLD